MANGGNGGFLSEKTWIPVSLAITLAGIVWYVAWSGSAIRVRLDYLSVMVQQINSHAQSPEAHPSAAKDIEALQRGVDELKDERDSLRDKLANYRAEVEGFRAQCYEQLNELQFLRERLAVLEKEDP